LNDYYLRVDESEQGFHGVPIHCLDEYICPTPKESSRFTEGGNPIRLPTEIAMLSSEARSKTQIGFMKKEPMCELQRGETVTNYSHIKRSGKGLEMHSQTNTRFNYQALGEFEILKSSDQSRAGIPLDHSSGKINYPLYGNEHAASDLREEFNELEIRDIDFTPKAAFNYPPNEQLYENLDNPSGLNLFGQAKFNEPIESMVSQGTMVAINEGPYDDTNNGNNMIKHLKKNRRRGLTYKRINSVGKMPNTLTVPFEIPENDREATENLCDPQSMKPARIVVTDFGIKYYKSHWMGIIDELL
jgi:hypothetical protein